MKLFLEQLCLDAGVNIRLHTRTVAVEKMESSTGKRIDLAFTESKSGREAWRAKTFIDASGDGDLAAQSGCKFDYGDPETGLAQPMSFLVMLTAFGSVDRRRGFLSLYAVDS